MTHAYLFKVGLYVGEPLFDDALNVSTTVSLIAQYCQPSVSIAGGQRTQDINKLLLERQVSASASQKILIPVSPKCHTNQQAIHLHVQQLENSGIVQGKDALEDEDVRRVNRCCPLHAGMLLKRIYGDLGPFPTVGAISYDWVGCRLQSTYPALRSRSRSTRTSKSRAWYGMSPVVRNLR